MYNNNTVFGHYASSNLLFEALYSGLTSQNLYRDFVGEKALNGINPQFRRGPDLKITRNSTATFYNSAGIINYTTANIPRFEYGPDGVYRGLLIEEARENRIAYSQDFSAGLGQPGGWFTTGVTLLPSTGLAPDNTNTATLVSASPLSGFRGIRHQPNFTSDVLHSRSIFIKQNVGRYVAFSIANPADSFQVQTIRVFDFQTKNWTPFAAGGLLGDADPTTNAYELPIELLPNDWIKIGIVNEPTNENANKFYIGTARTSAWQDIRYTNTQNIESFYIWGGQYEQGDYPSSYIPTVGLPRARAADNIVTFPLSAIYNHKESSFFIKGSRLETRLQGSFGSFAQGGSQYFELAGADPVFGFTSQGAILKYNLDTAQALLSSPPNQSDTTYTLIGSMSSNLFNFTRFYYAQDTTFVQEATSSGAPPVLATRFRLGQTFNNNFLNGHIQEFGYWPVYLPFPVLSSLIY
jgi:hypothetical protein